jgi:hypothetical protein
MAETNLGEVKVEVGSDAVRVVADHWRVLEKPLKRLGVLRGVKPQINVLELQPLNYTTIAAARAYELIYTLRLKTPGKIANFIWSYVMKDRDIEDFGDLLDVYASLVVGRFLISRYFQVMDLEKRLREVVWPRGRAPLAALHAVLYGRYRYRGFEIPVRSPVWLGVYGRFLKRFELLRCYKALICGLLINDAGNVERLKKIIKRYMGKPPPLDPFLKWLGE